MNAISSSRSPCSYGLEIQTSLTRPSNLPFGWAAFRELRQAPAPLPPPRRHGNWKHGDYSQERIASRRRFRTLLWTLKHGDWDSPLRLSGWVRERRVGA